MIAARFRSVYLVALVSVAGVGCYLVTQKVAAERANLARVERDIHRTRIAIRELETELGTRGSMAQLERWNSETLALAAPKANQFVDDAVQLASLDTRALTNAAPGAAAPQAPAVVNVSAPTRPAVDEDDGDGQPLLRQATYLKPSEDRVARATRKASLLDDRALAEIGKLARAERGAAARQ